MKLLGINGIEESSVYQLILAKGKAEGIAEGEAKGKALARVEAIAEAKAQERAAAFAEARSRDMMEEAKWILLRLGAKRLGPIRTEVVTAIQRMTDRDQVEALIEQLLEVKNWDELLGAPLSQ